MNTINEKISEEQNHVEKQPDRISTALQETFFNRYKHLRITMLNEIPEPNPIISIDNHIISTAGNLTMLSGSSKAGKSAFCSVILAGAIRGHNGNYDGFEPLYIDGNEKKKAVIHIDTEQAKHNHYKNLKNAVLNRSCLKMLPEYFYSYNIREMEINDRKNFTENLFFEVSKLCGGIHLVLIDGLADYSWSVNDEQGANRIVHFFEKLSIKYECPFIEVVHLNPGSNKERGHLGSQLQRKAESVLQIKKSEYGISYCVPYLLRNASNLEVPIIQFEYDKDKKYHTYAGIKDKSDEQNSKSKMLKEIAKKVFSKEPINYKEAVNRIMDITGKSEATAKRYIKEMSEVYNFIKSVNVPNQSKKEKFYVTLL